MSIKWKFILWGLFFYLATGIALFQLLSIEKWYFVIGEFLLIISILLFISLYHQLVSPIKTIGSALNLLNERDFSTRLSPVKQKEINELVNVYNKMSEQLHLERVEHEEKNLFLSLLIDASPSAIIVLNADKNIEKLNPSALKLFKLDQNIVVPLLFSQLPEPWSFKLSHLEVDKTSTLRIDGIRQFKTFCGSFMDKGFARPFIIVEEMTRELIKAERQSYEKVIRMMSHEVNNSVGAVNSVMQSVKSISRQFDENVREDVVNAIEVAIERNTGLNNFMSNFADVVKLPNPLLKTVDLKDVISKTLDLFSANLAISNIDLKVSLNSFIINADAIQMEQVFVNIVKNSIEAVNENACIWVNMDVEKKTISVIDNGSGFGNDVKEKLFTPFFSTKQRGQGIGLILVREILLNHGFSFKLYCNSENKTEFLIDLNTY